MVLSADDVIFLIINDQVVVETRVDGRNGKGVFKHNLIQTVMTQQNEHSFMSDAAIHLSVVMVIWSWIFQNWELSSKVNQQTLKRTKWKKLLKGMEEGN